MSETIINETAAVPALIAFRKVERGVRWTPRIAQADPNGPEFKLPLRWISARRHQEILAPGMMKLAGVGVRAPEEPDGEAALAVSQFRAMAQCQRDLARALVDFDLCALDPEKVGFTIKNCEDLMDGEEVICPPSNDDPEKDEALKRAFEKARAENQILPFTVDLMNVLLGNAPIERFQAIIIGTRDAWSKKADREDAEGNAGSPTSPAA